MIKRFKGRLLALCVAASLAACGGGGDPNKPAAASASGQGVPLALQGAYEGTSTSVDNPDFTMLVLEDGSLWLLYGNRMNGDLYTHGLIQGTLQFGNGLISSSADLKDYGDDPASPLSLAGSYDATPTLRGTVTVGGQSGQFTAQRPPMGVYAYDAPAKLADIAGSWQVLAAEGGAVISLQVARDGGYTGTDPLGCEVSGRLTPRDSGKNVFDVTLTVGPQASCELPNQAGTGVAVVYDRADGQQQLVLMVRDSAQKHGSAFLGARTKG